MPFNNLTELQHLYGLFNGLLLGGALIATLSAICLFTRHNYELAKPNSVVAIGFLAFGFYGVFIQHLYGGISTEALPDIFISLGRYSAPIALVTFIYSFVKFFEIKRLQPKYILGYRLLYVIYLLLLISIYFIEDDFIVLTMTMSSIVPLALIGFYYTVRYTKYVYWGNFSKLILLSCSVLACYGTWLISSGEILNTPLKFLLIGYAISYSLPLLFGFILVRYSEEQAAFANKLATFEEEELLTDLEKAVNYNQLSLVYQPQINLKTKQISGVEALLRWQHPEKGSISPGCFIPLAEKTPAINSISKWVINNSIKEIAPLLVAFPELKLSINFSIRNLHPAMITHFKSVLNSYNIAPQNIIIEITESTFLQPSGTTVDALEMINELGCHLSLDDYGTGFSSLSHINQLSLKELKIDRLFVKDIDDNSEHHIIVNSTIQMSKSLNLQVVAEGVETDTAMTILQSLECDIAQGYGIAKPMSIDNLNIWIQSSDYHL